MPLVTDGLRPLLGYQQLRLSLREIHDIPDVATNEEPFSGRVYVLVLDDLHTDVTRSERVRLAARHPEMEIAVLTAGSHAGKPLAAVFPHLGHLAG